MPSLCIGDRVRIHEGKTWSCMGKIIELVEPRSAVVLTDKGTKIRRNRRDILKIPNESRANQAYDYIDSEDEGPTMITNQHNATDNQTAEEPNDSIRIRSGRISRRPTYLNDYE